MLISSINKRNFLGQCHLVCSQLSWVILLAIPLLSSRVTAQISPDQTLPHNSIVVPNGQDLTITGGSRVGGNLFHSLASFSVPTGSTAFFNNALDIQNIITRVTGNSSSNIDGTLKANGTANLFFLNPNGINFGTHAALNIGGSFLGSTANRISFADGTGFSASNPQTAPLLTMSVPVGLQIGQNVGAINVTGLGSAITIDSSSPVQQLIRGNNPSSLQVSQGQSLALIGGAINLQGGVLVALGGRIELGSVGAGNVSFNSTATGWIFNYQDAQNLTDINLSQKSLLDASSSQGGGLIAVQGRNIMINNGSVILIENDGIKPTGNIAINGSESVQISGFSADGILPTTIYTPALTTGNSGNIQISTKSLLIENGAQIATIDFATGQSGDVNINASKSVVLNTYPSAIISTTYGLAPAGNLTLSTSQLNILNGAFIFNGTLSSGAGGKFTISADSINIIGTGTGRSTKIASSFDGSAYSIGNGGSLTINTSTLNIADGGEIASATYANGNAGNVTINALKSVEVSGLAVETLNPSQITASAQMPTQAIQQLLGLPPVPSGKTGNITINTPKLNVLNGGLINVTNQGLGNAGTLNINAGSIFLNNAGGITATTANGEGGNIILQGQNIQLKHNSTITATAGGNGNGGNLHIDTNTLALLENSNLIANAVKGQGGNINIITQGLFRSPDSDITASSQFGVSGTIDINNPTVNPTSGLVILPDTVQDPTHQVVVGCAANQGNSLTVTGLGGLPEDATATIRGQTIWRDWQDFSASENARPQKFSQNSRWVPQQPHQLVEATGWVIAPGGKIQLTTYTANLTGDSAWLKPLQCKGI